MKPKIYILSGDIQTGKSTEVLSWAKQRARSGYKVGGIINPLIEHEKRFIDASTFQPFRMYAEVTDQEIIEVGKYRFSAEAFGRAKDILAETAMNKLDYLIIDEIGKLELDNKGLEPVISEILNSLNNHNHITKVVCIVRKSLTQKVIDKYGLVECDIINKKELNEI